MIKRVTFIAAVLALALQPAVIAADSPSGKPTASETPFVTKAASDIGARFATTDAASKAGYMRYTDEDDTGAISYANRQWTSSDAAHPSQLWYDVNGKLLGADYSVPWSEAGPPHLFGVGADRWQKFGLHIHYGLAGPSGTTTYGATSAKKLTAAGGDPKAPTAADLVKLGIAKSPADVRFVFVFPAIWDLAVWIMPNPDGAFAEKNPSVKPQHAAKMDMQGSPTANPWRLALRAKPQV